MEKLAQLATVVLRLIAAVAAMIATRDITVPLVLAVVAMAGLALILRPLVQQVIDTAPKVWADVQDLILGFRQVASELAAVSSGVSQTGSPGVDATTAAPGGTAPAPVAVAAG